MGWTGPLLWPFLLLSFASTALCEENFTEWAADCNQLTLLGKVRPKPRMALPPAPETVETESSYFVIQEERYREVKVMKVVLDVVDTLLYCGDHDHQTLVESTSLNLNVWLKAEQVSEIHHFNTLTVKHLSYGAPYEEVKWTVLPSMPPTEKKVFMKNTRAYSDGGGDVECEGKRYLNVYGYNVYGVVGYATMTLQTLEIHAFEDVTTGEVFLAGEEGRVSICNLDENNSNYCGGFRPTEGNFIATRIGAKDACHLRRTTSHPMRGIMYTFPDSERDYLAITEAKSHFAFKKGNMRYDDICGLPLRAPEGSSNTFVVDVQSPLFSTTPPLINTHAYSLATEVKAHLDYEDYSRRATEQRVVDMFAHEMRQFKLQVERQNLVAITMEEDRPTIYDRNSSHLFFYLKKKNLLHQVACPLRKFKVSMDNTECCSELQVWNGPEKAFIAYYPDPVLVNNCTVEDCDPADCSEFELHDGQLVKQCPNTKKAKDVNIGYVDINGTTLDGHTVKPDGRTYAESSIFDEEVKKKTFRHIAKPNLLSSIASRLGKFYEYFRTPTGDYDPSGPTAAVRNEMGSQWGIFGGLASLFEGTTTRILLVVTVGLCAFRMHLSYKKDKKKKHGNNVNIIKLGQDKKKNNDSIA